MTSRLWWAAAGRYLRYRHSLRLEGVEHVPRRTPFVIVANHTSHLDALVIAASLNKRVRDRLLPLAAGDVFFSTTASAFAASMTLNALPMWRGGMGRHALGELRERLTAGDCGFVLFPEGTRSRDGKMGRFRPGVGMLTAGTGVAVTPAWVSGAFEAWPAESKRPRTHPVTVRFGQAMRFETVENERAGWERIAGELERAVRGLAEAGHQD